MQKTFSTVWVSSIEHMNSFNEISSSNSILKVLLFLNKVPSDFPQMKSVGRILPIVYFAKGILQIFEREIDFRCHVSTDADVYKNLDHYFNFQMQYQDFKVDRYLHPRPFMKSFNICWIRLSILNRTSSDHLLISFGGQGISMIEVKKKNDEIFEILKDKVDQFIK